MAKRFKIVHKGANIELPEGENLLGRSSDCFLTLDDPSASRVHAALVIEQDGLFVHDKGSRNGVMINGIKGDGKVRLSHGDELSIGHQVLKIVEVGAPDLDANTTSMTQCHICRTILPEEGARCPKCSAPAVKVTTDIEIPPQAKAHNPPKRRGPLYDSVIDPKPMETMAGLATKAVQVGKVSDGERFITNLVSITLKRISGGPPLSAEEVVTVAKALTTIAEASKKPEYISTLFKLHRLAKELMDRELVEKLYDLILHVNYHTCSELGGYLEVLETLKEDYAPAQLFVLRRVQGLVGISSR